MARTLALTDLGRVEAAAWPGLTAGLLAQGAPRLAVARLGGGQLAVGRWQRVRSSLTAEARQRAFVRRVTGGRTIALGEGQIALALALPNRSWLVGEDPDALAASRFVNRAVRGVLSGLHTLGISASYFGRDFVTVDSSQAGYVSFDIDAEGRALFECVLPCEAHWWPPAGCDARPPQAASRGVPEPGMVPALAGVTSAAMLAVVGRGYAERFGVALAAEERAVTSIAVVEEDERPLHSTLHEVPIGWVEAAAALAGGVIASARFHGDFLADSAGIRALEQAVVGAAPTIEALAPRINAVYATAARTLLGVDDLAVFADALVEACR